MGLCIQVRAIAATYNAWGHSVFVCSNAEVMERE